jgi:hypothetical protein
LDLKEAHRELSRLLLNEVMLSVEIYEPGLYWQLLHEGLEKARQYVQTKLLLIPAFFFGEAELSVR